ncbi:MAG: hypothetical protein KDA85_15715, partial [Planctomycetaceae bacterium]|nr:hypothetical protein [Planctomycetaceae bacterium]
MPKWMRVAIVGAITLFVGLLICGGIVWYTLTETGTVPDSVVTRDGLPPIVDVDKQLSDALTARFPRLNPEELEVDRKLWVEDRGIRFGRKLSTFDDGTDWLKLAEQRIVFLEKVTARDESRVANDLKRGTADRQLIHEWIQLAARPEVTTSADTVRVLTPLVDAMNVQDHPDALIGMIHTSLLIQQGRDAEADVRLQSIGRQLTEQGYSSYLSARILCNHLLVEFRKGAGRTAEAMQEFQASLETWLHEASVKKYDRRHSLEVFLQPWQKLSRDLRRQLLMKLLADPQIDDWYLHQLVGLHFDREAWDARGSGIAQNVSPIGWENFAKYQGVASQHYQRAMLLHPEIPFAADKMIMISLTQEDAWSPRNWLEIALRGQSDYRPALESYLHTLKPRWGGSTSEMLEMGAECAASPRQDTLLPGFVFRALDSAIAEHQASPQHLCSYAPLQQALGRQWGAFDDALVTNEKIHPLIRKQHMGWRAAIAMQTRDLSLLRSAMPHLTDEIPPDGFRAMFDHPRIEFSLAFVVAARGEEVWKLHQTFQQVIGGRPSAADIDAAFNELDGLSATNDPHEQFYLASQRRILDQLRSFLDGQWVDLTFEESMPGWEVLGDVVVESPQSVVVSNLDQQAGSPAISLIAPLEPPYQVEATLERIPGDVMLNYVGIEIGDAINSPLESDSTGRFFMLDPDRHNCGVLNVG